ncbi:hypothetical protein R4J17_12220 [Brachyspira intermedia]|uniref:hypothetical protein n=1 Tax=Brachyspira intermedia TaxID=84377 RepID=UPI00300689E2
MGKVKNVFTMATLYLIKNLLNFSSRLLPVFIIILSLLKVSKVLIDLSWYFVLSMLLIEVVLVIFALAFDSMLFKNKKASDNAESSSSNDTKEENSGTSEVAVANKFSVLNIAVVFFAFLGIIFVILKLFKAVAWSWVWVLSPLWLSTALVLAILLIFIIVFIASALSKKDKTKEEDSSTEQSSSENTDNIEKIENTENKDNTDNTDNKTE